MANRDIRFDICKGIAIFLMVCGHTSIPEAGSKFIWLFHMPLFFMISGYFFHPQRYIHFSSFLFNRMRTLVVPYIFFLCIVGGYESFRYNSSLYGIVVTGTNVGALWFLQVLFTVEMLFYAVQRFLGGWYVGIVAIASLLVGYAAFKTDFHLFYHQEVVAQALFYYAVGYKASLWTKTHEFKFGGGIGFSLLLLVLTFVYAQFLPRLDMASNNYGWLVPNILGAIGGTYVMLHLATSISRCGNKNFVKLFLVWAGKNTLVILGLSSPINMMLKDWMSQWYPNMSNIANMIIRHSLLWLLLYVSSFFLVRYLPVLIGKKSYRG